jgi:uncharacterized protein YjbI with pentapeptide repeats
LITSAVIAVVGAVIVLGGGILILGPASQWYVKRQLEWVKSEREITDQDYAGLLAGTRDSLLKTAGGLILFLGALGTVGTFAYGAQTSKATLSEASAAQKEADAAQAGQVASMYSAAITELSSPNQDVRVGGIYALRAVMVGSPGYQLAVISVLASYARVHEVQWNYYGTTPPDLQAAITVIDTRNPANDHGQVVDLRLVHINGAQMVGARLQRADLDGTLLTAAYLQGAYFQNAHMAGADLDSAHLEGADFKGADLKGTDFCGADLRRVRGLTERQVESAIISKSTELPPGMKGRAATVPC